MLWQFLAMALTVVIVATDFDWTYYRHTRQMIGRSVILPAILLGGLLPVVVPLGLWFCGWLWKNKKVLNTAFALGQAAIIGALLAAFYKTFTGRMHPPSFLTAGSMTDSSHGFHFGFLRGGIFYGWPSSHTTVAFAMAVAFFMLFPKNKSWRWLPLVYALYVGLSVSISIHWFSEFAAGAIFGTLIGIVVGRSFREAE